MVALYVIIALVALVVLVRQLGARREGSVTPSVERYHRAMGALGEISDQVKVLDRHVTVTSTVSPTSRTVPALQVPLQPGAQDRRTPFEPRRDAVVATAPILLGLHTPPVSSEATDVTFTPVTPPGRETGSGKSRHLRRSVVILGATFVVTGVLAGILLSTSSPSRPLGTAPRARTHTAPQIPSYEALPDVVGLSPATAERRLSAAGLRWHLRAVVSPSVTAAGTVLNENPVYPGTVRRGDAITLAVGKPYPTAKVPNVSGSHESAKTALAVLHRAGFTPKTNLVRATSVGQLGLEGDVVSQKPSQGSVQAKNSIVTINVVSGAALVSIPGGIVGETPAQAGASLAGAQLIVGMTKSSSSTVPAGDVAGTYPSTPGEPVPVGSTVNLVISSGPASVVPELKGDTVAEAKRALRGAGLVLGRVNPAVGPSGLVVAQAARPGRELARGTSITIAVGISSVGSSATTPVAGTTGT